MRRSNDDRGPRVNLDWRRLKAVVLESDDWGLCAWSPDEQAFRVLSDTPAFRSAVGRRYGGSTLEGADDIRRLAEVLLEFRGGDGLPPVWQANTVMAAPDYSRLVPPQFEADALPLVDFPRTPSRWSRPGLWGELVKAREAGVWWPELHGLHHLPETAWLSALRRGIPDARRAHEHQSPVCTAVAASSEYDPAEPEAVRARNLRLAVEKFRALFGRAPSSWCPPDYRWDESTEMLAESLGVTTMQGRAERIRRVLPRLRHWLHRYRWPEVRGTRFYLPPRIAFEPVGIEDRPGRVGAEAAHRAVRAAWRRGQPAVVSSHRVNYVHLQPAWSEAGRQALRDVLARLTADGAKFLTDAEVRVLMERDWSLRPIGDQGVLVRSYGLGRQPVRFEAPPGTERVSVREGSGPSRAQVTLEGTQVTARLDPGEYVLEWRRG